MEKNVPIHVLKEIEREENNIVGGSDRNHRQWIEELLDLNKYKKI